MPANSGQSPADAVSLAVTDARSLPPDAQAHVRYLWLGNVLAKDRSSVVAVLAGHLNGLSREPDIVPPAPVAGGLLLRVNLLDYGIDPKVWEQLADPLFTVQVEIVEQKRAVKYWPGGVWPRDGRYYPPRAFTYYANEQGNKTRQRALAPWLSESPESRRRLAELVALTRSQSPVTGGIWFLNQTAIQEGRSPGYYDFLGVKNQRDWERLVRFDSTLAARLEHRRVVVWSGITLQPRRIERTATTLGGLYRTFDSEKAIDRHNPIRILDDTGFLYDAQEAFAAGLNGIPKWLLANSKGELQTRAPDTIVGGDRTSPSNDTKLHVNLSCLRCHMGMAKHEHGIKDFVDEPIKRLSAVDYAKLRELRRQYLRDVGPAIDQDRRTYAAAIKEATGLEPQRYAAEYGRWFSHYEDARADLAWLARDLGLDEGRLGAAFLRAEVVGKLDPVLTILLAGRTIPIRQAEEVYLLAWQTWREYGR